MKEKVLSDSPNRMVQILKATFIIALFLGTSNVLLAQNPNANENATVYGGEITFIDGETYTSVCVGDGEADYVEVVLENASGRVKQWIVTNEDGDILGLPDNPSDVNFDGAGVGICYIYHLSYNGIKPLVDPSGQGKFTKNVNDIVGRFDLSEPIMVERFQQPTAGVLEGGPFEFCVGDGEADNIPEGSITLSGNSSTNEAWVVTDADGNILGLPPTPYAVNFDEAPAGVCLIWHLGYEDNVSFEGVENAADLMGCFELSNPITVNRYQQPTAGVLEGGPFEFCVGDGEADNIPEGAITLSGNSSTNEAWVVTDAEGNILGLPPTPYVVNFDEAPAGVCLVWHLGYEDNVSFEGVENAADLMGCFELSNPIAVNRYTQPTAAVLEGGPFEFCVGDGEADNIPEDGIMASGGSGTNSTWVVTDDTGKILGAPDSPSAVNFDGAGAGVCLIWYLTYEDNVDLTVENANDLTGCYALSNPITVNRYTQPTAAVLEGGPFEFCVGDGEADNIPEDGIMASGGSGTNSTWVVTDDTGKILGAPDSPSAVNFDGAGAGVCLIWYLTYEDNVDLTVENANDLTGCYALSNPITVNRTNINGGTLTGGENNSFSFTVGDGTADNIAEGAITLEGNMGTNSAWVVTNGDGTIILGLPTNYYDVNFDGAGAGTCLVWHLSYENGLEGLTPPSEGDHLVSGLTGACFDLSNAITVNRTAASAGKISIFPNPTKGTVNIDVSNFGSDNYGIQIFNMQSRELYSKSYTKTELTTLDVSDYGQGIYFVRVSDLKTGNKTIKRFVVE